MSNLMHIILTYAKSAINRGNSAFTYGGILFSLERTRGNEYAIMYTHNNETLCAGHVFA